MERRLRFRCACGRCRGCVRDRRGHSLGARDEDLLDVGLGTARDASDGGAFDGRVAPAEDPESFIGDDLSMTPSQLLALAGGSTGKNVMSDAIFAGGGQGEAQFGVFAGEVSVRDLDEEAGAIASFGSQPQAPR